MATEPLSTRNEKKQAYKALWIIPLHITHPGVAIPVQNLQVSQQFSPNYKKEDVYGRMDPIATFSSTTRTMRIGFSCQAHHFIEGMDGVIDNIQAVNEVTQMLYPAYEEVGEPGQQALLKAPPFFRIKYGQYFGSFSSTGDDGGEGITGYISGFSHGLGKLATNMAYGGKDKDSFIRALPREIKVSFSFQVIHDKPVGWSVVGDKSVFSADGYGANFPYNTGVVDPNSVGSKKSSTRVPDGLAPETTEGKSGAGGTTPKVLKTQPRPKPIVAGAKARLKNKSTKKSLNKKK